jgi:tetratricopeptide (TPR) repeat protein
VSIPDDFFAKVMHIAVGGFATLLIGFGIQYFFRRGDKKPDKKRDDKKTSRHRDFSKESVMPTPDDDFSHLQGEVANWMSSLFEESDDVASLTSMAEVLIACANRAEAVPLLLRVTEIKRKTLGEGHPDVATSLSELAKLHYSMGNPDKAEPLFREAMEIQRTASGEDHPEFATSLNNLASALYSMGKLTQAEPLLRQALEIERKARGESHFGFAICVNNLAELYLKKGEYAQAEPLCRQLVDFMRQTVGEEHPHFAGSLEQLAGLYSRMGKYPEAELLFRQALEIHRGAQGEKSTEFIRVLDQLAELLKTTGNYAEAEALLLQAMEMKREVLGETHPAFATNMCNLGWLYTQLGDYTKAEPLLRQAVEIYRTAYGEDHPDFAISLNNLAGLCSDMGNFAEAETLCRQAVDVFRLALGENHPHFANSLNSLAVLYAMMGKYAQAEPLYRQSIEIRRATLGEAHADLAASLSNLARLHYDMGDYAEAELLYLQALEVYRAAQGEGHPDFAQSLNSLAGLYSQLGEFARAEPLFRQALESRRIGLGEGHPDVVSSLNNLALLYQRMGNFAQAEPLFRQAVDLFRGGVGEQHPRFATSLGNLATLLMDAGNYAEAEPLCRQSLEIQRMALGEGHPQFAGSLHQLASLYIATSRAEDALPLMGQAAAIDDRLIGEIFSIGSDRQRTVFLRETQFHLEAFLSLVWGHLAHSPEAVRATLDLVLRRKAIGAEVQAVQRDVVFGGKYPHLQPQLRQWLILRQQIAQKTLAGAGSESTHAQQRQVDEWQSLRERIETELTHRRDQRQVDQWQSLRERIEADLARQIPEMNLEQKLRAADRRAVALALEEGTALVEFVHFKVWDFKALPAHGETNWQPARYLAFILLAQRPDDVRMIDLGEAEPIDRMIELFRGSVGRPPGDAAHCTRSATEAENDASGFLRAALLEKTLSALDGYKRLLISPDGDLARLPFAVLPGPDGRLLLDSYHLSYVNAGRDVLRFGAATSGQASSPLIVTDPDFDLESDVEADSPSLPTYYGPGCYLETPELMQTFTDMWIRALDLGPGLVFTGTGIEFREANSSSSPPPSTAWRHSRDLPLARHRFERLSGTRAEGESIARLLGVQPWQGREALEGRIKKECCSPRILHLATHGFFLENQVDEPPEARGLGLIGGEGRLLGPLPENPLLRAGLALAGANTWLEGGTPPEEAEDGLLTAEDVSGLDLLTTELVVLSACQTGLGEVKTGEGVFGLQRAFTLAGARTLVMSLWSVPDEPTRELMEDFYQRILAGERRADALQGAQRKLRDKYPHPFFWGAFICQGDPAPMKTLHNENG